MGRKKIILILAVIVAGALVFSLWHSRKSPLPKNEKENISVKTENESPFGFLEPFETAQDVAYYNDLGAKNIREGRIVRNLIEKSPGNYDWSKVDKFYKNYIVSGSNIMFTVSSVDEACHPGCKGKVGYTPCDINNYSDFFQAAVKRYKDKVKFWQIGNEVNYSWKESPEKYADFLKLNYSLMKKSCSDCQMVIAGVSSRPSGYYQFYQPVLAKIAELNKNNQEKISFIFDFHWAGWVGNYSSLADPSDKRTYDFKKYIEDIENDLNKAGIDPEIWITEMSTYSGDPSDEFGITNPPQTEKEQAAELVKRHAFSLVNGIKKIFWVKITEWNNFAGKKNGFYDNTGLANNPASDRDSSKKLSYYAYKKMTETLDGSDWNNIETIQDNEGVYVYKFTKNGKRIWVAWSDNANNKNISLSGIKSGEVSISQSVPDAGKKISDYANLFVQSVQKPEQGKMNLTLDAVPVYVVEN